MAEEDSLSSREWKDPRQEADPPLHALAVWFDDLFARMQGVRAREAMAGAFAMTPAELGEAAVRAAGKASFMTSTRDQGAPGNLE